MRDMRKLTRGSVAWVVLLRPMVRKKANGFGTYKRMDQST